MNILLGLAVFILILNIVFSFSLIFIERRDPTTTWAWLLIFILIPGFGFIIYLLFGQNLSRQKIFKEKIKYDEIKRREVSSEYCCKSNYHDGGEQFFDLKRMNFNNLGSKYTMNNKVKIFFNGEDKFSQLIEDIRKAKKYIHVEYYIFRNDMLGKIIIRELTEKAKQGLEVRLLVDSMGSYKLTKRGLKKYINAGIIINLMIILDVKLR